MCISAFIYSSVPVHFYLDLYACVHLCVPMYSTCVHMQKHCPWVCGRSEGSVRTGKNARWKLYAMLCGGVRPLVVLAILKGALWIVVLCWPQCADSCRRGEMTYFTRPSDGLQRLQRMRLLRWPAQFKKKKKKAIIFIGYIENTGAFSEKALLYCSVKQLLCNLAWILLKMKCCFSLLFAYLFSFQD